MSKAEYKSTLLKTETNTTKLPIRFYRDGLTGGSWGDRMEIPEILTKDQMLQRNPGFKSKWEAKYILFPVVIDKASGEEKCPNCGADLSHMGVFAKDGNIHCTSCNTNFGKVLLHTPTTDMEKIHAPKKEDRVKVKDPSVTHKHTKHILAHTPTDVNYHIKKLQSIRGYSRKLAQYAYSKGIRFSPSSNKRQPDSLLIPNINEDNMYTGIMHRWVRKTSAGSRYSWEMSHGLTADDLYFAIPDKLAKGNEVYITEGALKAIVMSFYLKRPVISVNGIQRLANVDVLRRIEKYIVENYDDVLLVLTPDWDYRTNESVAIPTWKAYQYFSNTFMTYFAHVSFMGSYRKYARYKALDDAFVEGGMSPDSVMIRDGSDWLWSLSEKILRKLVIGALKPDLFTKEEAVALLQRAGDLIVDGDKESSVDVLTQENATYVYKSESDSQRERALVKSLKDPGTFSVFFSPPGTGKTHWVANTLMRDAENNTGVFKTYDRVVYISQSPINPTVDAFKDDRWLLVRGRTQHGQIYDKNEHKWREALPGEKADPDYGPNCAFADSLRAYYEKGLYHVADSVCKSCPFTKSCPYKETVKESKKAKLVRTSWTNYSPQPHDLVIVDESIALDPFQQFKIKASDIATMRSGLSSLRIGLNRSEMSDNLFIRYKEALENLEILIYALKETLTHDIGVNLSTPDVFAYWLNRELAKSNSHLSLNEVSRSLRGLRFNRISAEQPQFSAEIGNHVIDMTDTTLDPEDEDLQSLLKKAKPHVNISDDFVYIHKLQMFIDIITQQGGWSIAMKRSSSLPTIEITSVDNKLKNLMHDKKTDNSTGTSFLLMDATPQIMKYGTILRAFKNTSITSNEWDRFYKNVTIKQILGAGRMRYSSSASAMKNKLQLVKAVADASGWKRDETGLLVLSPLYRNHKKELRDRFKVVGYFMNQDRGTNIFYKNNIRNLITLGVPIPNIGAMAAQADALSSLKNKDSEVKPTGSARVIRSLNDKYASLLKESASSFRRRYLRMLLSSTFIQSLGRLRSIRRPNEKLNFLVVDEFPTGLQNVETVAISDLVKKESLKKLHIPYTRDIKFRKRSEEFRAKVRERTESNLQRLEEAVIPLLAKYGPNAKKIRQELLKDKAIKRIFTESLWRKINLQDLFTEVFGEFLHDPVRWDELSPTVQRIRELLLRKASYGGDYGASVLHNLTGLDRWDSVNHSKNPGEGLSMETKTIKPKASFKYKRGEYTIFYIASYEQLIKSFAWMVSRMKERDPDHQRLLALDIETAKPKDPNRLIHTAYDPMKEAPNLIKDKVRLISIKWEGEDSIFVLDAFHLSPASIHDALESLGEWTWVGHNIKFDLSYILYNFGLGREWLNNLKIWDTYIAEILALNARAERFQGRSSLKAVAKRRLDIEMDKTLQVSNWGIEDLTRDQITYSALDVTYLEDIARDQIKEEKTGHVRFGSADETLKHVREALPNKAFFDEWTDKLINEAPYFVEMNTVKYLALSEAVGLRINTEVISKSMKENMKIANTLKKELEEELQVQNADSVLQVKAAFSRLGIEIPLTGEGKKSLNKVALNKMAAKNPVAAKIVKMRTSRKIAEKAGEFLKYKDVYGRVHTSYKQHAAPTGRMSSTNPATMNLGRKNRTWVKAAEGMKLVGCDYSQIELRLGAEYTGDRELRKVFINGKDPHKATAAAVAKKPEDQVTKNERQKAKAINFGLMYGMGPKGLRQYAKDSYGVSMTEKEAKEAYTSYHHFYKEISAWQYSQENGGGDLTYTLLGRRLGYLSYMPSLNYPIQGSGADILKLATIIFNEILGGYSEDAYRKQVNIVNYVHDELVVEAPEEISHEVAKILEHAMIAAGKAVVRSLPIKAEASVGDTWNDLK